MPAPIIDGFITYLAGKIPINIWDGEIPRYDQSGNPINPTSSVVDPANWPILKISMMGKFTRNWTTEDAYYDEGRLLFEVYGTDRIQLEDQNTGLLNKLDSTLSQATNWKDIELGHQVLGGGGINPFYVISCLLEGWDCVQLEGERTADSQFLYKGEMIYEVSIHGAISTY